MSVGTEVQDVLAGVDVKNLPDYARAAYEHDLAEAQSADAVGNVSGEESAESQLPIKENGSALPENATDSSRDANAGAEGQAAQDQAVVSEAARLEHKKQVEEGRQRKYELAVENRRLKNEKAELEAKLATANGTKTQAADSARAVLDIESLELTDEQKEIFTNHDGTTNEALLSAIATVSRKANVSAFKELQEIKKQIEASQKAQFEFQEQVKLTKVAEYQVDIQEALEMPIEEVNKLRADPGFQKFASRYNELAGETIADSIVRAEKNLNSDPLIAAVRDYRALQTGGQTTPAAAAQKAAPSLGSPVKPGTGVVPVLKEDHVFTQAEWDKDFVAAQALIRNGDPSGRAKASKLFDAADRGQVR
jgi:hypothetical protein